MISIVCPFYNEEAILESSVELMLRNLQSLSADWELIIVNDGSTDSSLEIARDLEGQNERMRVVSYAKNRGRGFALRTGVQNARGAIVVTTEIDSSWGDDIVYRLVAELEKRPEADIIIASPHLPAGGYRNVPLVRVLLSTIGNYIIRTGLNYGVTMNTGMTRGYRRKKFLALALNEEGKELHLEIVNKALAFGYRIFEIPVVLEWKDHKLGKMPRKRRRSKSNVSSLIRTHLLFSVEVSPSRYLFVVAALLFLGAGVFFVWAVINLFNPQPSIYVLLTSFFLAMFAMLIFGIAAIARQNRAILRELWRLGRGSEDTQSQMYSGNRLNEIVDTNHGGATKTHATNE